MAAWLQRSDYGVIWVLQASPVDTCAYSCEMHMAYNTLVSMHTHRHRAIVYMVYVHARYVYRGRETGVCEKDNSAEEDTWEYQFQKHKIGGWRVVSAAALHGQGSRRRSVFSQTPGGRGREMLYFRHPSVQDQLSIEVYTIVY